MSALRSARPSSPGACYWPPDLLIAPLTPHLLFAAVSFMVTSRIPSIRFITIYPDLIHAYLAAGTMKRAATGTPAHPRPSLRFEVLNLREFALDKHGTVDGKPYGGMDSMVLRADVLAKAIARHPQDLIISTAPSAAQYFDQTEVEWLKAQLAGRDICFICGRFGGIDARFEQRYINKMYSFGDFVAAGGELPCLMIAEAIARLMPGVLGNAVSASADSFGDGKTHYLEHPLYTQPRVFEGLTVPEELLSGNHQLINQWKQQFSRTKRRATSTPPPSCSHPSE